MKTRIFQFWMGLIAIVLIGAIASCQKAAEPVSSPASSPTPIEQTTAKITEIASPSVSVKSANGTETPATTGMPVQIGETITTKGKGAVQVELSNGLGFRVGNDAAVTLEPNNRINIVSGQMITWVQPGRKVPTEIVTPVSIAGIRGTTVYVEIAKVCVIFSWEGTVSLRLPNQPGEITLRTGEEVKLVGGEKDLNEVQQKRKQFQTQEWSKLLNCVRQPNRPACQNLERVNLYRNFKQPLPTLAVIEKAKPGK